MGEVLYLVREGVELRYIYKQTGTSYGKIARMRRLYPDFDKLLQKELDAWKPTKKIHEHKVNTKYVSYMWRK